MATDIYTLPEGAQADLGQANMGTHLFNQMGPSLYTGAPTPAAPLDPGIASIAGLQGEQYARYSAWRSEVGYEQNLGMQGPGSSAVYLLHPDNIRDAGFELDERELRAEMSTQQWTEPQIQRLSQLTREYPGIAPGVLEGMALGQIDDSSPTGQEILQRAHEAAFIDRMEGMKGQVVTPEKIAASATENEKQNSQNPLVRALRGAVRNTLGAVEGVGSGLALGAEAAWLEAQGQGDAGERLERLGEEGGGGFLGQVAGAIRGEEFETGAGWLPEYGEQVHADAQGNLTPDGQPMTEDDAAHRRIMQYEGRFLTPGRVGVESLNAQTRDWFGWNVIEPGTKPYHVASWATDTAWQLARFNPSNVVADAPMAVRAARRAGFAGSRGAATRQGLFEAIGGVAGARRTVDSDQAIRWLDSKDGGKFIDHVAGVKSITQLMGQPGLALKDADILSQLDNPHEIKRYLGGLMGQHITSAPIVPGRLNPGSTWRAAGGQASRMMNLHQRINKRLLPHFGGSEAAGLIQNPGNLDGVFHQMQPWMDNARFTPGQKEAFNRSLARVQEGDSLAIERILRDKFDPIARSNLVDSGIDQKLALKATQRWRTKSLGDRTYWVDAIGNPRRVAGSKMAGVVNGEKIWEPSPAMMAEYINGAIPMPDPGEMRRISAMKGVHWLVNKDGYKNADRRLGKLIGQYWKPVVLLRPSYVTRVVGAEQARIAAQGMDSFLSDPVSMLAWAIGRKGDIALDDGTKLLGDAKQFRGAMNRLSTDVGRQRAAYMNDGHFSAVNRALDEDKYFSGWANELQMVAEDPVAQHLLNNGRDATIDWFWDGQGRLHREALMTNSSKREALNRRGVDMASEEYVDSVEGHIDTVEDIIDNLTGGDTLLREGLRTGKLNGIPLPDGHWTPQQRRQLRGILTAKADAGAAPSYVRGIRDSEALKLEKRGMLDRLMDGILTHPTNKLSRAPMFKQSYWDNMMRLAPDMDDTTLGVLRSRAREAKLDKDYVDQLDQVTGKSRQSETVLDDIDAADLIAKDEAMEQVKELLYDPTIRGNFASMTRNIFPFAEAWKEELTVWSRLMREGQALKPGYRLQQSLDFLGESDPFDLDEPDHGPGVLYTGDDGREMFAMPIPWMTRQTPEGNEVRATLEMSVEGASMMNFNTFLPGLGPVAQIPVGALINMIPDKQYWLRDTMMDLALPFGGPELKGENLVGELAGRSLPSWMRAAWAAVTADEDNPDSQLQMQRMTHNTLNAMYLSGDIAAPRNQQEAQQAVLKAARTAGTLQIIEAVGKAVMPSSPQVEWQMRDENERLWTAAALGEYFWDMREEFGEQAATAQLITHLGTGALNAVQLTQSETMRPAPLDKSEWDWAREHSDFYKTDPAVALHFTETKDEGGFSFDAYYEGINNGSIMKLPLWQQVNRANDRVGAIFYRGAQDQAEKMFGSTSSEDARLWLRERAIEIKRSLHGYGSEEGFQDMSPEAELALVGQALTRAPENRVTEAIDQILRIHDEGMQLAGASGSPNYYASAEMEPVRQAVLTQLDDIVAVVPEADSVARLIRSLTYNASTPEPTGMVTWGDEGNFDMPSPMLGAMAGMTQQPSQGGLAGIY